jgi:hypothetical protein
VSAGSSALHHPPSAPIPAFRRSLSFSSLIVYPSLLSFRSVPSSSLSGSFHPFLSFIYLQLVVYPSLSLFRSVPSSSLSACDSFVRCTSSDPQAFEQRDRTCAKFLSDKVSLREQRGPASFDFKQTLPVQSLHSLCSVALSSSVGYA